MGWVINWHLGDIKNFLRFIRNFSLVLDRHVLYCSSHCWIFIFGIVVVCCTFIIDLWISFWCSLLGYDQKVCKKYLYLLKLNDLTPWYLQHSHWWCLCYRSPEEKKWKTWHFCFLQMHWGFTSSWVPWCWILTDHDHATGQFPLLGVSGLSPFDEVVAVRYNNIIESTIIRYFWPTPNLKYQTNSECK